MIWAILNQTGPGSKMVNMQSLHAKHKIITIGALLALFLLPFVYLSSHTTLSSTKASLAGGAVIGNRAFSGQNTPVESTNATATVSSVAGTSLIGATTQ
jgi:hypothetical protein